MIHTKLISHSSGLQYYLTIKNVKNINLRVNCNGDIIVSAPMMVSLDTIDIFITSKIKWIQKAQYKISQSKKQVLLNKDEITLFGKTLKIKLIESDDNYIYYDDSFLYVLHRNHKQPHILIQEFLQQLCYDVFHDITKMTIRKMKYHPVEYPKIKIRSMKRQWGNCHLNDHYITLNRLLIHYPFEFIEYVILHELVHFHEINHTSTFYNIVEYYMPDYQKRIELVKEFQ